MKAPFIPKLENQIDTQNFDREFTECDIDSNSGSIQDGNKLEGFSY